MSLMEEQREIFEKFCVEHYGGFRNSSSSCPKSKTVTRAKGESIVKVLKGNHGPSDFTPQFKHWVKQRGFKLISYQSLGLKDVLCLPAKKKVSRIFMAWLPLNVQVSGQCM